MAQAPQSPEDAPPAAELRPPACHRTAQTEGGVPAVPGHHRTAHLQHSPRPVIAQLRQIGVFLDELASQEVALSLTHSLSKIGSLFLT